MPAPLTYVAGVQIGRCESRVCVVRREASGELTTVQFVQSDTGARSTPCVIALSATGEYVIGEAAETQMAKNADATVPDVAGDVEIVLTPPPNEDEDEPPAKPGKLRGEDGAAKVLGRLKSLVDDFLGVEGNEALCCVVAVPSTILGDAVAMASLKRAAKAAKLECLSRRDGEALYGHCVTFLKRRQKIDVAEGGKKAQRKLRVACVRAAKVLGTGAAEATVEAGARRRRGARVRMTRARFDDLAGPIYAKAGALGATAAAAFAASATKPAKILPLLCGGACRAAAIHKAFVGAFEGFELVEDPGLLGSQVEVDELAVHGAATQAALLAFGAQPLIDEAATKVAKGAKKYASARADFCLATAALPVLGGGLRVAAAKPPRSGRRARVRGRAPLAPKGSPVPATHAASLELAGDGAAAFVVAFDGDAPLAVLDCSKFAGASKVELAATLDEKANLKLVATVDGDENPVSLDVPASA
ncbi:ATP binding protein [Aureococcus anophagefferens]|nr:ATP binding protein [Aureococcus anophagefferens]